ncbi:C4-dicarboxylate transporter [Halorhabdus sp. BNX81]|uniref:SLAC1 family transporter n=1 Tax=Halorhabdus sp. BNX81 TaxID=2980181 RepID=UPI0023DD5BE5|nr:C4-dicarboxylate transporter [Halorhabdus sp. BNX81]WEL22718.1 Tellurite resistance protein [Halorhabdus sp. BNX81]
MSASTTRTGRTESRLAGIPEYFGPQWFGSTMGTGALGVALALVAAEYSLGPVATLAQFFVVLTAILTVVFTIPWVLRIVTHPDQVRTDLSHPIRSQFFPTMPITLIVLGVGIARTMQGVLPAPVLESVLVGLFVTGSIGIFGFGLLLVTIMFANDNIGSHHGVFAWYIPPVSHLVIPLLGFWLVENYYAGSALGQFIFVVSLMALGVGSFMFIFFGSIILHRYAYESLPEEKLAPTFVIGLAPTAVLVIAIGRFIRALQAGVGFDLAVEPIVASMKLLAIVLWGFSAWWFLLTVAILAYYLSRRDHPFFFTWWAYTFPTGAFAISAGVMGHLLEVAAFEAILAGVTGLLVIVWTVTALFTTRMILRGHAFTPE